MAEQLQAVKSLDLPISAQSLVYGKRKSADPKRIISQKDFFWDQLVLYMGSAILGLTILDISVEFLRGSRGVVCFTPYLDGNFTRDQAAFVNGYCSRSLPLSEFYPVFIIVQGLLLLAPQYLWESFFQGYFDDFFGLVKELDRLRDPKTGDYSDTNVNIVGKLEAEFSCHKRRIFRFYAMKLALQVFIGLASIGISEAIFRDFSSSFNCPRDEFPPEWPLDFTVTCSFSSLRVLSLIRYVDYFLIGVAVLVTFYGLLWCFLRHSTELGFETISLFCFSSGLTPDSYRPPTVFGKNRWCTLRERAEASFKPRIMNDLDFLIMRLFRSDAGVGLVFKDIQIQRRLKYLQDKDHELLHIYIDAQQDQEYRKDGDGADRRKDIYDFFWRSGYDESIPPLRQFQDKIEGNPEHATDFVKQFRHRTGNISKQAVAKLSGIRDVFFAFTLLAKNNLRAFDVTFGAGGGYILELARAFKLVISINFHPFYRNFDEVCCKANFVSNFSTIKVLEDIYTRNNKDVIKFATAIHEDFADLVTERKRRISNEGQASIEQANEDSTQIPNNQHQSVADETAPSNDNGIISLEPSNDCTEPGNEETTITEQPAVDSNRRDSNATLSISELQAFRRRVNFIVVGPISDPAKLVTANILMERAHTPEIPYFEEDAILLSVRPLQIEDVDVSSIFHQYVPPEGLFEEYDVKEALKKTEGIGDQDLVGFEENWGKIVVPVGEFKGIYVKCGDTHTVFEFKTYRYRRGGLDKAVTTRVVKDTQPDNEAAPHANHHSSSTHLPGNGNAGAQYNGGDSPSLAIVDLEQED